MTLDLRRWFRGSAGLVLAVGLFSGGCTDDGASVRGDAAAEAVAEVDVTSITDNTLRNTLLWM